MTKTCSKDRILTSARALFFEKGFENVSTDLLASEASVSKATIYRHFKNMLDILDTVARDEAAKFKTGLPRDVATRDALQRALTEFGTELLGFLNQKETLDFSRLIHEEARANPQLGQTFYAAAVGRIRNDLGTLFASAQNAGIFKNDFASTDIAEDFIALLQGFCVIRVQLRVAENAFSNIEARVSRAVHTIMTTHAKATCENE